MLIPEITKEQLNIIGKDPFGRISGVFLLDKPEGVTSHDVVDDIRRILRTKHVGHAGALDPFASGLLMILVGKYTKYTEALISLNKAYKSTIVFGLSTDTQDPEGKVMQQKDVDESLLEKLLDKKEFEKELSEKFMPSYQQLVPIFSSVKVGGHKLRELARSAQSFEKIEGDKVKFNYPNKEADLIVELPRKQVSIDELQIGDVKELNEVKLQSGDALTGKFASLEVEVACSKGTYIRQLAEDIGEVFEYPSFLNALQRTRVGEFSLTDSTTLAEIYKQAVNAGIQNTPLSDLRLRTVNLNRQTAE